MRKIDRRDAPVRAFDNPVLERLSRIHPAVPACVWGPVAAILVFLGYRAGLRPAATVALVLSGTASWTFAEYALHRWVFHWKPANPRLRKWFYPVHELHHDVQEWDRLVAPPLMAIPIAATLFAASWGLLGWPRCLPFFGGFLAGYLVYDYVHLYTHFGRPRSRIGKGLRRRHLQHHFAYPDRWYGISSPLWDFVFRTHVDRNRKPARAR
jgi:hypothetical protein